MIMLILMHYSSIMRTLLEVQVVTYCMVITVIVSYHVRRVAYNERN